MRLDPGPFLAAAEAAVGSSVALYVDAKRRRGGEVLGRSGMLCLTEHAAVFIEDRVLQPGAIHVADAPRVLSTRRDYLGAEFEVQAEDGLVVFSGIDESEADSVARGFAQIALSPLLEPDDGERAPNTAEIYGEPDVDDLEIEAEDADIEESADLALAALEPLLAQRTNPVQAVPVVEFAPLPHPPPMPTVAAVEPEGGEPHQPGDTLEAAEIDGGEPTTTWPVVMACAALGIWISGSVAGMIVGAVIGIAVRKPVARALRM